MHLRRVLARARQRRLEAHLFDSASSMVLLVRRLVSTKARVHEEYELGLPQCSRFTSMVLFGKSRWHLKRIKSGMGIPIPYHSSSNQNRPFAQGVQRFRAFAAREGRPHHARRMRRTTTSRCVSSERDQGCTHTCHMQCHKQRAEGATCQTLFHTSSRAEAAGSVSCSHAHCRFFADEP